MSRCLGIDYGEKWVGVALSDEEGNFAFPKTVFARDVAVNNIKEIVKSENIGTVVVGLPLGFSMQETASTKNAKAFGELLQKEFEVEVVFQNEVLSTKEAEKSGVSSRNMIDASSAALILQSFLDTHRQK